MFQEKIRSLMAHQYIPIIRAPPKRRILIISRQLEQIKFIFVDKTCFTRQALYLLIFFGLKKAVVVR